MSCGMVVDDEALLRFEAGAHENGVAWWSARWLMELLGYATWVSSKNVLTHALSSCMTLGLDASENFLASVIAEARRNGAVTFRTASDSARDFVSIGDVCRLLPEIAMRGNGRIYNVASGRNVSNGEIAKRLEDLHAIRPSFAAGSLTVAYPPIDTGLIQREFGFTPTPFEEGLMSMFAGDKEHIS